MRQDYILYYDKEAAARQILVFFPAFLYSFSQWDLL